MPVTASRLLIPLSRFHLKLARTKPPFWLFWFMGYTGVAGLLLWLVLMYRFILPITDLIPQILPTLLSAYPQDLTITISQGQASTNQPEPYVIPLVNITDALRQLQRRVLGATSTRPDHLLVIDTQANLNAYPGYRTYALLTQTALIFTNISGHVEIIPLNQVPDAVITRHSLAQTLSGFYPVMIKLPLFIGAFSFLIIMGLPLLLAALILLESLLLYLPTKLLTASSPPFYQVWVMTTFYAIFAVFIQTIMVLINYYPLSLTTLILGHIILSAVAVIITLTPKNQKKA